MAEIGKSLSGMATPINNPTPLYEHEAAEPEMRMTMAAEAGTAPSPSKSLAQMATPLGYREGEAPEGANIEELVEKGRKYGEAAAAGIEKLKELRQKKVLREALGEAGVPVVKSPSLLEKMFPPKAKAPNPIAEAGVEVV